METRWLIQVATLMLEYLGVAVITLGVVVASIQAIVRISKKDRRESIYELYRRQVGKGILIGLELLVAADIIQTVAIEPTYQSVGVLAAIIVIRTFLSFTLEVEMTGFWPWQRPETKKHSLPA